jgi:hypothetical protein
LVRDVIVAQGRRGALIPPATRQIGTKELNSGEIDVFAP